MAKIGVLSVRCKCGAKGWDAGMDIETQDILLKCIVCGTMINMLQQLKLGLKNHPISELIASANKKENN